MAHGGKREGAGRKKGAVTQAKKDLAQMAKEHAKKALGVLVQVAQSGTSEAARVSAANSILDRAYGKPTQAHEHSGPKGAPISTVDLTKLSDEQLSALETIFGPLTGSIGHDEGDQAGEDPSADGGGE